MIINAIFTKYPHKIEDGVKNILWTRTYYPRTVMLFDGKKMTNVEKSSYILNLWFIEHKLIKDPEQGCVDADIQFIAKSFWIEMPSQEENCYDLIE